MHKRISIEKLSFFLFSLIASVIGATYFPSGLFKNETLVSVIATTFSITAGVLVAILSVLISTDHKDSWQYLENNRTNTEKRLLIFQVIFSSYFISIGFLIATLILNETQKELAFFFERLSILTGTFAFIHSLTLPQYISNIYLLDYDSSIQSKKGEEE